VKLLPEPRKYLIRHAAGVPSVALVRRTDALLLMLPAEGLAGLGELPYGDALSRERARLRRLPGSVWTVTLPTRRGTRVVAGELAAGADAFQQLTLAGRMLHELAAAEPRIVALASLARGGARAVGLAPVAALLAALLAATEPRPSQKSKPPHRWRPAELVVCGAVDTRTALAVEDGAHLARWLTALPPNVLYPGSYRRALAALARRHGWRMRTFSEATLRRLGAGAFVAVARGSRKRDAALVRLEYGAAAPRHGGPSRWSARDCASTPAATTSRPSSRCSTCTPTWPAARSRSVCSRR
jgi:leucyl aminopeptidase